MGMVVQHNISAQNANEAMRKNVAGLKKSTEKLSTGYSINRAADNAAGLAISEKMRSQIRGLTQATANSNDAISLIQTAEGGLQESEDIMQRMRELAVQSANGTYTDEDREQIQYEVDALKSEVDRIAQSTEFNTMKLLDGSLANTGKVDPNGLGPKYSALSTTASISTLSTDLKPGTIMVTSDKQSVTFSMGVNKAVEKGSEIAVWNDAGTELSITLAAGETYTEEDLNKIIAGAKQEGSTATANPANVKVTFEGPTDTASFKTVASNVNPLTIGSTTAGVRGEGSASLGDVGTSATDSIIGAKTITFTANKYGQDMNDVIIIKFDADGSDGKKEGQVTTDDESVLNAGTYTAGTYTLHLSIGKEYDEETISKYLQKGGLDYTAKLEGPDAAEADHKETFTAISAGISAVTVTVAGGKGWSASDVDELSYGPLKELETTDAQGGGLTFQIGANGVEDQRITVNIEDMSSKALGIAELSVAKQDDANAAITQIDDAIKAVSTQRAKLGAVQNRLEHTVNSLNTANENLSAAESQIRDTDMASEMIKYTKSNILQQASQSMLAQANQQPQGVLQLLG